MEEMICKKLCDFCENCKGYKLKEYKNNGIITYTCDNYKFNGNYTPYEKWEYVIRSKT